MTRQDRFSIMTISSLFFAITFLAIGYGMILTFVGIYLKEQGVSNTVIGLINSAFFMGAIASSIFSQKIISSVGHIRSFATFASIMVVSFLIHSIFFNEIIWAILRLISGFSFYGLLIILESWLNEKSSHENRGKVLAIYTIIFYLSTALGQLFLNIDDNYKKYIFTIGSVLILFSVVFISLTKIKEPILKPFEQYSLPKIYSVVPLATTSSLIGGFFVGAFFTMFPVYILTKYNSVEVVSYFMLITLLGGLTSQWPIGLISDKYGRRKVISVVSFFTALISGLFIIIGINEQFLYICGFLLGLTIFSLYPLGVARANDVVDENKDLVEISRTLLFTYGIGSFCAPIFIGFLFNYYSEVIFLIFIVIAIYLAFYSLSRKRIADDDLSTYVNMPVASGLELPVLDPRTEEE
ncbi:MAG: MFS transporter [Halarcobacter sp.]